MRLPLLALGLAIILAGCNEPSIPTEPPELTEPPEVATSGFLTAYTAQTIAMPVADVRTFMEAQPLTSFLEPTENIANPVESEVIRGVWPNPGAYRWLKLADGHYIIERILENEEDFFKYQVFVFTNATGQGVEQIVGEQRFVSVDSGTRLEWTYNVLPTNFVTRQFVRRSMDEIETYISGGLEGFAAAANASIAEE
ncbi:hypothetical protein [Yoonia sp. 2307UL14-13]|uniref:hypothetical protein n=1 Tax=Yoonia sp. 2307UL14-13 TaxID=3126506 RepID=UPI0030AA4A5F